MTTVSNYYTQVTSSDIKTNVHINIKKYIVPPVIEVSEINFIDENVNNSVDAFESNSLSFLITNTGPGPAIGMIAEVKITGTINGITCNKNHVIPSIETGKKQEFSIPLTSSRFTTNGIIKLEISIVEPNGFSPDPFFVEIKTQAFRAPRLDIVDYSTSMNTWVPNSPVGFDVLLQNTGQSSAENINVNLTLPNSINCYSNNISLNIDELSPSESVRISYDILVPRNFNKNYVEAYLNVTEKFGDYGASWSHEFPFEGGNNSAKVIAIESADGIDAVEIDKASLNSNRTADVSFNQVPKDIVVNTVAVLPIDGIDCSGKTVSGQDLASFTEGSLLGLYNVVERRNLERVLDEQKLALSGILYEKSAVEAGCNVGDQGIIFTEYGCLTGQEVIQLKLVDCQTSELYWSATGINATAKQVLDRVREELGKE